MPQAYNPHNRLGGAVFWYFLPEKRPGLSSRRVFLVGIGFWLFANWAISIAYGVVDRLLIEFTC